MHQKDLRLAVIGLGYVGFPLAIEFAKNRKVFGFDINEERIKTCKMELIQPWKFQLQSYKILKILNLQVLLMT